MGTGECLLGKLAEHGKSYHNSKSGMFGGSTSKVKSLLEAARSNNLEELKKIAEGGTGVMSKFSSRPNLNSSDIRGKNALIYGAAFGHKEILEYLLTKHKKEVDVNTLDDTSKSALHHACKKKACSEGNAEIISMLIEAGAHLEARDHNGWTPLMFAVANGNELAVKRLVQDQANLNVKDFEGHTCLDHAKNFGHDDLLKLLKKSGTQLGHPDEDEQEVVAPVQAESRCVVELEVVAPV